MSNQIRRELRRIALNSARRREDLLVEGLRKSRTRKLLNVSAGILALLSAGAITAVITDLFGDKAVELLAAIIAMVSGSISFILSAYFSDDEIINRLSGASQYLHLRESAYRTAINPTMSEEELYQAFISFQDKYAGLDESFARYLSLTKAGIPSYRKKKHQKPTGASQFCDEHKCLGSLSANLRYAQSIIPPLVNPSIANGCI